MTTELQSAHSVQVVRVAFYGDEIDAVDIPGKGVMIGVKRVCSNLGIDPVSQFKKLKSLRWSGAVIITAPDERGRPQELAMIPLKRLPMWMTTINENKVAPELREKIARYQDEAAEVLENHFCGTPPGQSGELAKATNPEIPVLTDADDPLEFAMRLNRQTEAMLMAVFAGRREAAEAKALACQADSTAGAAHTIAVAADAKADRAIALAEPIICTFPEYLSKKKVRLEADSFRRLARLIGDDATNRSVVVRKFYRVGAKWPTNIYPVAFLDTWLARIQDAATPACMPLFADAAVI